MYARIQERRRRGGEDGGEGKKVEKKKTNTLVRLSIGHMLIIIQRGHNIAMHTVQKY